LAKDSDLSQDSILIIDPLAKTENDKTWSFWEIGEGQFDSIVRHQWRKGIINTKASEINLDLGEYVYKTIRAIDFYNYCKSIFSGLSSIQWVNDKVESVSPENTVITDNEEYYGKYIYDSRISPKFWLDNNSTKLKQHFLGWVIHSERAVFDPESFVMMDFRDNKPGTCSFTYLLPYNEHNALVEFTLFSLDELDKEEYEYYLKRYLTNVLNLESYQITETEAGVIPMTDFRFESDNRANYVKIGTAGGWVKPSTGYSFKNSGSFISGLVANIKAEQPLHRNLFSKEHRLLDRVFLDVLARNNHLGEKIFGSMYLKLSTPLIFKFLDEKTTTYENLRVISRFPDLKLMLSFLRSFFRKLIRK